MDVAGRDHRTTRQSLPWALFLCVPQWALCPPLDELAHGGVDILLDSLRLLSPITTRQFLALLLDSTWYSNLSHRLANLPLPACFNSHTAPADQVGNRRLRHCLWTFSDFANH